MNKLKNLIFIFHRQDYTLNPLIFAREKRCNCSLLAITIVEANNGPRSNRPGFPVPGIPVPGLAILSYPGPGPGQMLIYDPGPG